jgi:protoporphyrinogen IX oxidase
MTDFLSDWYPWIKALHIISVITWMAGIFYLPRLFVYHVEKAEKSDEIGPLFQEMEHKLLRTIMNPAMIATWIFGLCLAFTPGLIDWTAIWPWTKAFAVLCMTQFHHWLALRRKDFVKGQNTLTGRQYRIMNEVPTVLLIIIVFSVVLKF